MRTTVRLWWERRPAAGARQLRHGSVRMLGVVVGLLTMLQVGRADAGVSVGAWVQHSPDDISGFTTLSGNDAVANVTLPFTLVIEGTDYTTLTISTNGWIEFGGNTCTSGCGTANSDPANTCLPTDKHTNPFLAAYWDDMQTQGTHIRYGTVGASPHRTFIADFVMDVVAQGSSDVIGMQVQVHEGSNLITVRYRGSGAQANGQAATIGYQGAGGSSATAYPLTCNGKVLDDNQDDEGWSVDAGRAGAVTMFAMIAHSPDDISGFTTLSGNDALATPTMPFSVQIDGVSYNTVAISTNGWMEFGGNTCTSGCGTANSDPINVCLPAAKHTNPFLAVYWDDMQTQGTAIRYGTVGSSPNRTFITDFLFDTVASGSSDVVGAQVQVHETANLISVKYYRLESTANGQAATIGFQRAGGSAAAAYPLTCNGKVLDDDREPEGFSVHAHAAGGVSMHAIMQSSPNDLSGLQQLTGDNATAGVTLPFAVKIDGASYNTLTIGTNGLLQFGTTSGANPATNTALPSASFPNPTLFWFWDDLQTFTSHIQYGVVGLSPNRTFLVDFQENLVGATSNAVNGQVQIHEGSSVINVKYRGTLSAGANGQTATIGFQGAGGAAAAAHPLTFNGKILDDNIPNAGWSVAPLPGCGNGIVEGTETCDEGVDNGTDTSCCTVSCTLVSAGTTCRTSGGDCYVANACTGTTGACPATLKGAGSTCDDDGNACTTDLCNGGGGAFVGFTAATGGSNQNHFINSWTFSGSVQTINYPNFSSIAGLNLVGNAAQVGSQLRLTANVNNQVGAAWFNTRQGVEAGFDTTFVFQITNPAADGFAFVVQNAGATAIGSGGGSLGYGGIANSLAVEFDTHNSGGEFGVPHVSVQTQGGLANSSGDAFSLGQISYAAMTNGAPHAVRIAYLPASRTLNVYLDGAVSPNLSVSTDLTEIGLDGAVACVHTVGNPGAVCRSSLGPCDPDETCTGTSTVCPADVREGFGVFCSPDGNPCTLDYCDGTNAECQHPPGYAGVTCRTSAGECDPAEVCTGTHTECPADSRTAGGTPCTADSNPCTLDQCDGSSASCQHPAGNAGTLCRTSAGACDPEEVCTGTNVLCPDDARAAGGTSCSADGNPCTLDECDGSSVACQHPPGNAGTECRASAGECDVAETCTGTSSTCPADAKVAGDTPCADDGNPCTADVCDGSSAACQHPAANANVVCRTAVGPCDAEEHLVCEGTTEVCPPDDYRPSGAECRASAGDCDPAELCSGSSVDCPADTISPADTACPDDGNPCTTDVCDGTNVECQHAVGNPGTVCREAAGDCDVEETCTGTDTTCPDDAFLPSATACPSDDNPCTVDECDGSQAACPYVPGNAEALCRSSTGECDPEERCTGSDAVCPADAVEPSGTPCSSDGNPCTLDACDGTQGTCQHPAGNAGSLCRDSAGACDPAETCTGTDTACPSDSLTPSGTLCRSSAGVCDPAEVCTGTSAACPADAKSTALCRAAAGQCDAADFCDGLTDACPADAALPNGTSCDDGDGCPADTCQNGACQAVSCPVHDTVVRPVKPVTLKIPLGIAFVTKTLSIKVRNADVGETSGHVVALSIDDSDCGGGVASQPDFIPKTAEADSTTTILGGKTKTAKVRLTAHLSQFSGSNPKAPSRCTLWVTAEAVVPGGHNEARASNNLLPIELNVIDLNDPPQVAVHETAVKSLKTLVVNIGKGKAGVVKKAKPQLVNADPKTEVPGDLLTASVLAGTCPPGLLGAVTPDSVTVSGGAAKAVTVPIEAASADYTTPNKLSPERCIGSVSVVGPGGDTIAANNSTHVVIDVLDKNDF